MKVFYANVKGVDHGVFLKKEEADQFVWDILEDLRKKYPMLSFSDAETKKYFAHYNAEAVLIWTDAPVEYDGFGTATIESAGTRAIFGHVRRLVAVDPNYLDWQKCRYASGLFGYLTVGEDDSVEGVAL